MWPDSLDNLKGLYNPFLLPYVSFEQCDTTVCQTHVTKGYDGIVPEYRMKDSDAVFLLFTFCFLFLSIILLRWRSYVVHGLQMIFRIPKRSGLFLESQNISRVNYLLMPITIIMLSFFFYIWINGGLVLHDERHWIRAMAGFIVVITLFYWLKFVLFDFMAYLFFTSSQRQMWNESYMSHLVSCGLFSFPVFLFTVYSNAYTSLFPILYMFTFLFFRLVQLQKTFVIFIEEYTSLLYLILYLCSVEIMPAILLIEGLRLVFYIV